MAFVAERLEIESALPAAQFAAQRREARLIDVPGAQDKPVGSLVKFQPVAGLHPERVEYAGGKSDLTLGGYFDEHGGGLRFQHLTYILYS